MNIFLFVALPATTWPAHHGAFSALEHERAATSFTSAFVPSMPKQRRATTSVSSIPSSEMPMNPPPLSSPAYNLFSLIHQNRLTQQSDDKKKAIQMAGIHDALSAKIFAEHGAPVLFLSGFGVSASLLGIPDAGMTNLVEMEMVARHCISAVNNQRRQPLPLIVDGDTGYGGAPNMLRTISSLASTGAAAITIEDQSFPKKCTIAAGSQIRIVGRKDAIQRVKGALGARDLYEGESSETTNAGAGVWIVARTDCRLACGFNEVVERCLRFEEMGADIVYAENLQSIEEYKELRARLDPRTVTMVAQVQERSEGPQSTRNNNEKPLLTIQDVGSLGYDLALFGVTPLQCVVGSLQLAARQFYGSGSCDGTGIISQIADEPIAMADFNAVKRIVGFGELEEFERQFPCG